MTNAERQEIDLIHIVYEDYLDFNTFDIKLVDYYCEELGLQIYIKQDSQVRVYAPKTILKDTTSVSIDSKGYIVNFLDKNNKSLLKTYSKAYEDVVGLKNVKGFILG